MLTFTKSAQERIDEVLAKAVTGAGPVEQVQLIGILLDYVEDRGIWPPDSLAELREMARWAEALAPRVGSVRIEAADGTVLVQFPVLFDEAGGKIIFKGHADIIAAGIAHTCEIILPGRFHRRGPVVEVMNMNTTALTLGGTLSFNGDITTNFG